MKHDWALWQLAHQRAPRDDDWTTWLILGGRGAGKTRAGAEWIRAQVEGETPLAPGQCHTIALIGETYQDVREVMIDGPSGLMATTPPAYRPHYEVSRHRLVWPNGAIGMCFSATDPNSLRGYQFEAAWSDEICKWEKAEDTWSNLQLGLRLGKKPRQIVTTTPRPTGLLKLLQKQNTTRQSHASTHDNKDNLATTFLTQITSMYEGTSLGRQELLGEVIEDISGALWNWRMVEAARIAVAPPLDRIVVAVDPPVTSGANADECGIIVAGETTICGQKQAYVLADKSIARATPLEWSRAVIAAYHEFEADRVVIEVNQGGDLVENMLRQVDPSVPVKPVRAYRSKNVRAEPVAALYEQGRVRHVDGFAKLEDQLTSYVSGAAKSPDRLDALVWAITDLLLTSAAEPRFRVL